MEARPIRVLEDHVARKIAAGEVIDRPHSVVRELMDNALDAEARAIDVHVEQGGLRRITVRDDGLGMSADDLELCWQPHATSKVATADDLEAVYTLGFRGEALASIAEVSRLRISSTPADADLGHRLEVNAGERIDLCAAQSDHGTTIEVRDLFYAMPARRRFLKRPSAESAMVRNVFIEKALPFPERTFRLFTDDRMKLFLPESDLPTRIATAFPDVGAATALQEISGTGDGFTVRILAAGPEYHRKDRKLVQTFVNKRRVWEYALVQAIEYGFSDYLPGGSHPVAFLFLEVDPSRVDFNIHPAKREIRFRNFPEIHHRITRLLQEFLRKFALRFPANAETPSWVADRGDLQSAPAPPARRTEGSGLETPNAGRTAPRVAPTPSERPDYREAFTGGRRFEAPDAGGGSPLRYLGQVFRVFLLAEYGDTLYIVDQHAGHEKVLFTRFHEQTRTQDLLVTVPLEVSAEEHEVLSARKEDLLAVGIGIRESKNGDWELYRVPAVPGIDAEALGAALRELAGTPEEVLRDLYATMSCKAAIKEGDAVDPATGQALLEEVFSLDNAHCPHGRPVWHEITRAELYRLLGRT
ncbi:MAG: DNA mismatch repair endonuclease MutL [Spirochaetes bacterium]|jgi:DNA mismatch repair protein MutL|nr:DNA mismatch repair endonuclease MutL [Spirochaetota bacterium]